MAVMLTRESDADVEGGAPSLAAAVEERFTDQEAGVGQLPQIQQDNTLFVVLSFEGPDPYSLAGGLGRRVSELTCALAENGFETHLFFIGDPARASHETSVEGRLHHHRWCTWISQYHPLGVYDGEIGKLHDYQGSVPRWVVENLAAPARQRGKRLVVLSEEWHTAPAACDLSDALFASGLRNDALMLWNANNTMGFHRIDWERLKFTHAITTVSHWMKHVMWQYGCNPLVVQNGIPARMLCPSAIVDGLVDHISDSLRQRVLLTKVARFDPDKRWLMAVEATAGLKRRQLPALLVARGGIEEHGMEVIRRAAALGLTVHDAHGSCADPRQAVETILAAAHGADVVNVRFHLTEPVLSAFYRASDAVLANSGREPFGLVGLEVMASGGVAFTGATGEEYARPFRNAIVLETDDPTEIEVAVMDLLAQPRVAQNIRIAARRTASYYTWDHALAILLQRCQYLALAQGWTA
jgi:glycosyltransferase involved in cell wall biosynthesis